MLRYNLLIIFDFVYPGIKNLLKKQISKLHNAAHVESRPE